MTRTWTNGGASTDWYTASNWTPATGAGGWTSADIALFQNTGVPTLAQIDMSAGLLSLGAISLSMRTHNLTIGNSSPVAGTGLLQLNGTTVNNTPNVILSSGSNIPPYTLLIEHQLSGCLGTMEIVLGNPTDNVIISDGAQGGSIAISAPISGTGKKLSLRLKAGGGTDGKLTLTGSNTYTGLTTVQAKNGRLELARCGGGTLPPTNDVEILDGTLNIKTNQTLHNVKVASLGFLLIDPGATLTITGRLDAGTPQSPGGLVRGTIVFA